MLFVFKYVTYIYNILCFICFYKVKSSCRKGCLGVFAISWVVFILRLCFVDCDSYWDRHVLCKVQLNLYFSCNRGKNRLFFSFCVRTKNPEVAWHSFDKTLIIMLHLKMKFSVLFGRVSWFKGERSGWNSLGFHCVYLYIQSVQNLCSLKMWCVHVTDAGSLIEVKQNYSVLGHEWVTAGWSCTKDWLDFKSPIV